MKTVKEVSALLNIAERTVRQHCHNFQFEKIGRDYILSEEQIEQIKSRIGQRGKKLNSPSLKTT